MPTGLKRVLWDVVLFFLASPVLAVAALRKALRRLQFFLVASRSEIGCECGSTVALVGLWKCGCGFTYQGHLLTVCPVCASVPCVVRCYRCGITTKLPEP